MGMPAGVMWGGTGKGGPWMGIGPLGTMRCMPAAAAGCMGGGGPLGPSMGVGVGGMGAPMTAAAAA